MGDWDYINEHMGGHDDDGLPNFMSRPGFADNSVNKNYSYYSSDETDYFETFEEAKKWAKKNPGKAIARSQDGKGYIKK